ALLIAVGDGNAPRHIAADVVDSSPAAVRRDEEVSAHDELPADAARAPNARLRRDGQRAEKQNCDPQCLQGKRWPPARSDCNAHAHSKASVPKAAGTWKSAGVRIVARQALNSSRTGPRSMR